VPAAAMAGAGIFCLPSVGMVNASPTKSARP
jgi:hypothetical protein